MPRTCTDKCNGRGSCIVGLCNCDISWTGPSCSSRKPLSALPSLLSFLPLLSLFALTRGLVPLVLKLLILLIIEIENRPFGAVYDPSIPTVTLNTTSSTDFRISITALLELNSTNVFLYLFYFILFFFFLNYFSSFSFFFFLFFLLSCFFES